MLTARAREVSAATWRSRYWRSSQLFSPSLPPFARESSRKQSYAQAVQQRCVDENVSVKAHRRIQGLIHVRTLLHIRACVCGCVRKRGQRGRVRGARRHINTSQAYTERPRRTLPCVKLLSCGHLWTKYNDEQWARPWPPALLWWLKSVVQHHWEHVHQGCWPACCFGRPTNRSVQSNT